MVIQGFIFSSYIHLTLYLFPGNCSAEDAVEISFNRLVHARYVERCPAHEPFLAPPEEETGVKKKGSKSAKVSFLFQWQ